MGEYEAPVVQATYSVDELAREAATCESYNNTVTVTVSDRELKDAIGEIEASLDRVKSIRTE
jgi:hypothetical protein